MSIFDLLSIEAVGNVPLRHTKEATALIRAAPLGMLYLTMAHDPQGNAYTVLCVAHEREDGKRALMPMAVLLDDEDREHLIPDCATVG